VQAVVRAAQADEKRGTVLQSVVALLLWSYDWKTAHTGTAIDDRSATGMH
jgi:hypothetical protein